MTPARGFGPWRGFGRLGRFGRFGGLGHSGRFGRSGPFGPFGRSALVAAALGLWLAATAGLRPLALPDEGRYVGIAWAMLRSGDWLTPQLNGLPFFHKPPLFYWITAASLRVFGAHEAAARAAPWLGAMLAGLALYLFLRRWRDERTARIALVALTAQPLFMLGGQFANLDMLVAGCIAATVLAGAHAALAREAGAPHRAAVLLAWALAAAGVLAKGLIGLVLPSLVLLAWLLLRRQWRGIAALAWPPALLLFALLALPWFVAEGQRFPGFWHYFVVVQHFERYADGGFNNVQPWWFFAALLALLNLPWLAWQARAAARRDPVTLLMLLWAAVVVVFFSLPKSKIVGYVLPAVPPLAALAALGLLGDATRGEPSRGVRRGWAAAAALGAVVSLATVLTLALRPAAGSRELAAALRAQRAGGEPVLMLERFAYDLPFYAGLDAPLAVVDDWDNPAIPHHDNWRKELADAATFAPARAHELLADIEALRDTACRAGAVWLVGGDESPALHPFLREAALVYRGRGAALWRVEAKTLGCYTAEAGRVSSSGQSRM